MTTMTSSKDWKIVALVDFWPIFKPTTSDGKFNAVFVTQNHKN